MKSQTPKHKFQINSNTQIQNSKQLSDAAQGLPAVDFHQIALTSIYFYSIKAAMNGLLNEIVALIEKLEDSNPVYGSNERVALDYLKRLKDALGKTKDLAALEPAFASLEQFQVSSVAWCSQLSKDIEKIIIMYQEQL
jgi:hypothetical protein